MAQQLPFEWPTAVRMGADSYFVSDANAAAHAMVMTPEAWPDGKLILRGPEGSGKSHLARLFAETHGAALTEAQDLSGEAPLPNTALVIEDLEHLAPGAQEWLFHTHNHLRATGHSLLLTTRLVPSEWPVTLPDLASRLAATTSVAIGAPDETLLQAVLLKQFEDRQLAPSPAALTYLCGAIDRSFEAARLAVAAIDAAALAEGREITRDLIRAVLDKEGLLRR